MKKIIGLTGPSTFTNDCITMIEDFFDANVIMLYHSKMENVDFWLERCAGIVLAGGVDIHPTIYDRNVYNNSGMTKFDLQRDLRELYIIDKCQATNKPLLGICRGHQMIGIVHGMPLIPDIGNATCVHQPQRAGVTFQRDEPCHFVNLTEGMQELFPEAEERKYIKATMGERDQPRIWVNSFHHQGLKHQGEKFDAAGNKLQVMGTAACEPKIQLVELMRGTDGRKWVSCQWHPEYDWEVNTPSRTVLTMFKDMLSAA